MPDSPTCTCVYFWNKNCVKRAREPVPAARRSTTRDSRNPCLRNLHYWVSDCFSQLAAIKKYENAISIWVSRTNSAGIKWLGNREYKRADILKPVFHSRNSDEKASATSISCPTDCLSVLRWLLTATASFFFPPEPLNTVVFAYAEAPSFTLIWSGGCNCAQDKIHPWSHFILWGVHF